MTLPDSLPLVLGLRTVDPSTPQADSETSSVFSDKDTASPLHPESCSVYFDKDTASPVDPESSPVYFDSVRSLGSRAIYSEGGGDFSVGVIQVIQMINVMQIVQKTSTISNTNDTSNTRREMETSPWEGGRQARRTLRRTRAPAQFARRRPTTR